MEDIRKLMEERVAFLNKAARVYYQESNEIISNQEYDKLYDELLKWEEESGIVLAGSPTVNVGYQVISNLPKEKHPLPMLSLDKTKDPEALRSWLGDKEGLLSWKLDGLTIVLTYEEGKLTKAVTRGDGVTGEVITNNAKVFDNIPLTIPKKDTLVVRGEAVITYEDFEKINETIGDADAKYKNPRNLCAGTVRQLNNEITASRHVRFYAFSVASGIDDVKFRHEQLEKLAELGFETVDFAKVDASTIIDEIGNYSVKVADYVLPSDGLVLIYDDIEYGRSLGRTAKFPRDSMAFKWRDELKETTLREILWSPSRTGLINPIAIFDAVDLEGTSVSRASVHNVSIVKNLKLGIGDTITVYKANMIIPQIAENMTGSGNVPIPQVCPVCGAATQLKNDNGVETLHCPNVECPAKKIKSFSHFVGRNTMNIDGLSEATLEKLVDEGMVAEPADLFKLDRYEEKIVAMEGFGRKSYENLLASAKAASNTTPDRLLNSLGVPGIGTANARVIAQACENKWAKMRNLTAEELTLIDGVGDVLANGYVEFFANAKNAAMVDALEEVLTLDESFETSEGGSLDGLTFVITGKVHHFDNRDQVKEAIVAAGGKTTGSVTSKTDYLINNDITSTSGKNKKAKELGIPIITEDDFLAMLEG
ncbi:MAG: NAD-dependent DNA ligase LigA [Eubacterium sp.]|nr:NAD-dependent DNA ligase LigA [Candidatus Colimonas fimequi]